MLRLVTPVSQFFDRRSATGLVIALIGFNESLTPSLLPRSWAVQGLVSGVVLVLLYLIGAGLARLAGTVGVTNARVLKKYPHFNRWTGWFAVALLPIELVLSLRYYDEEWAELGFDLSDRFLYSGVLLVTLVIVGISLGIAWVLRKAYGLVFKGTNTLVPKAIAGVLSFAIVATFTVMALSNVFYNRVLDSMNDSLAVADTHLSDNDRGPRDLPTKSGTEESLVDWDDMGRQGRSMMNRAPSAEDISARTMRPALDPIRAFVGRPSAETYRERAELAVAELERMGGFDREILLVLTPTGTGWMNEQIIQPLEYFYDGNTATVGMQYSHLPSPFAFLAERTAATESAAALLAEINAKLASMDDPPRLLVAGESLGAFGGQGPFANLDALIRQSEAAIWTGSPPMAHLRREAERRRDDSSLQIRPEISELPEVVFGARPQDFEGTDARYAFAQHGNDPIVWWDNQLIFSRPDWLEEPLDESVNPDLTWRPITTYLQISADMIVSNSFEEGYGHLYGALPTVAWWEMLEPEGWSRDQMLELYEDLQTRADRLR